LRLAPEAGLSGLDPHSAKAIIDIIVASQVYDTFIGQNSVGKRIPALASAWKIVDPTTWEITLRKGVAFHDGTPFNASAAKYNIDRVVDPTRAGRASLFAPYIEGAEVVDDSTVRVKTRGHIPYLPYILGYAFLGIVSPKAATNTSVDINRNPVGTGPFKFKSWVEKESVEMVANDAYWGGRPKLGGITWKLIPSESARVLALRAGEVDAIANPPTELISQLVRTGKFRLIESVANAFVGIWINPEVRVLSDVRVRRAIHHAIDQQAILKNIIRGAADPAYQLLGPAVFGMLTKAQIPKDGFYPYDPAKAKQLLTEAGWRDTDGDGLVEQGGQRLTVVVQTPDGRYLKDRQIGEATTSYLRAVGIDASLRVVEFPTHSTGVTQHRVEVFVLSWGFPTGYPEPGFYSVFHSTRDGGPASWAQWRNPEADALMDRALVEPSSSVRQELYRRVTQLAMDQAIIKPLYWKPILWLASNSVKNLNFMTTEEPVKLVNTEITK
jgi:peptide/nickel transport system substrate-binding protein